MKGETGVVKQDDSATKSYLTWIPLILDTVHSSLLVQDHHPTSRLQYYVLYPVRCPNKE